MDAMYMDREQVMLPACLLHLTPVHEAIALVTSHNQLPTTQPGTQCESRHHLQSARQVVNT